MRCMKRILLIIVCFVLVLALVCCSSKNSAENLNVVNSTVNTKIETPQVVEKFNKILPIVKEKNNLVVEAEEESVDEITEEIVVSDTVNTIENSNLSTTVNFNGVNLILESNDTGNTIIGYEYNGNLENLTLTNTTDNITEIGSMAFDNCKTLKSVDLSGLTTLKKIGYRAFNGCTQLSTISIPSSVTTFGENAFTSTPWLTAQRNKAENGLVIINSVLLDGKKAKGNIILPSELRSIANKAFAYNTDMTSIKMNTITKIPTAAFYFATGLVSVDLQGVNSIEVDAFYGCSKLETVLNMQNVSTIASQAFCNCKSLTNIDFANSSISRIGRRAFVNCSSIQSIIFPATLTNIGVAAFYNCSGLESITFDINDALTLLPDGTFQNCTRLTSVQNMDATLGVGVFLNTKVAIN